MFSLSIFYKFCLFSAFWTNIEEVMAFFKSGSSKKYTKFPFKRVKIFKIFPFKQIFYDFYINFVELHPKNYFGSHKRYFSDEFSKKIEILINGFKVRLEKSCF